MRTPPTSLYPPHPVLQRDLTPPGQEREAAGMIPSAKTVERESLTRRYGKAIFARLEGVGPLPFSPAWWDERLMDLSMGDEAVKLQLFRFVDVLPQLRASADITRHLREYFAAAGDRVPRWMRLGLRL